MNDVLIHCNDVPWTQVYEGIWIKDLRSCDVTGQWTQLLKMEAGAVLPTHFHLGAGEFYVVKGEFVYRGGTARTGDYGYEPLGALHEAPRAAVETVLFYVGYGPLALLNPDGTVKGVMGSRSVNDFQSQAGTARKTEAA
jgi:anti-sigma factor ChrR (cupin superfamily)